MAVSPLGSPCVQPSRHDQTSGPLATRRLLGAARSGRGAVTAVPWAGVGLATMAALAIFMATSAMLALLYDLRLAGFGGPATISLQFGLAAALMRLRLPGAVRSRALVEGLATLSLIALSAMVFSYGFQLLNFPLQDARLLAADRAIGFDQRGLLDWVEARPAAHAWISQAYFSFAWQILLTVAGLALLCRPLPMEQFLLAFGLALFATCALSGLVPATSLVTSLRQHYGELRFGGASPVEHILALRDGSLRRLEVGQMGGIVSFPSFHVATAVLTTAAWRKTPVLWLLIPVNVLLTVGALTEGAHYLVDLVAGAVVGTAAWAGAGLLLRRSQRDPDHVKTDTA